MAGVAIVVSTPRARIIVTVTAVGTKWWTAIAVKTLMNAKKEKMVVTRQQLLAQTYRVIIGVTVNMDTSQRTGFHVNAEHVHTSPLAGIPIVPLNPLAVSSRNKTNMKTSVKLFVTVMDMSWKNRLLR